MTAKLRASTLQQIDQAKRKLSLRIRLAWATVAAMLLAGIWVDWRWFPSAVVPVTVALVWAMAYNTFIAEEQRRAAQAGDNQWPAR